MPDSAERPADQRDIVGCCRYTFGSAGLGGVGLAADGADGGAGALGPADVPAVVVDAALIVDVGASAIFDFLVVVTATVEQQVERLMSDRGMTEQEARGRITSQVPDSKRVEMADLVIENSGTLDELKSLVAEGWSQIERRARSLYG